MHVVMLQADLQGAYGLPASGWVTIPWGDPPPFAQTLAHLRTICSTFQGSLDLDRPSRSGYWDTCILF